MNGMAKNATKLQKLWWKPIKMITSTFLVFIHWQSAHMFSCHLIYMGSSMIPLPFGSTNFPHSQGSPHITFFEHVHPLFNLSIFIICLVFPYFTWALQCCAILIMVKWQNISMSWIFMKFVFHSNENFEWHLYNSM
jgi:hypothetical protein